MFDRFLKPKFYLKCKSYMKFINTRLEMIRKKRNAVQKFMKGDIAELLRNGLDYNAYTRAEGLLLEQNMSSCYDLIANFIACISNHLEELCKQQRDCPDECKEAIASLMYAAAVFGDLPELRDLRSLFTEKFGNSLEPYISQEFVEKLRRNPPTKEMKNRLLYDIAQEFSTDEDGKALVQTPYTPHPSHKERPKLDPLHDCVDEAWHENNDVVDVVVNGKGNERRTLSQGNDGSWRHQSIHISDDDNDETSCTDMSSRKSTRSSSLGSVSEYEAEIKKPSPYWLVPPPYLKQKPNKVSAESNLKKETRNSSALPEHDTRGQNRRPTKSYVRGTSLPSEHTNLVETSKGHVRANSLDPQIRGRVHPNLPDYDDLAARLAALRSGR